MPLRGVFTPKLPLFFDIFLKEEKINQKDDLSIE